MTKIKRIESVGEFTVRATDAKQYRVRHTREILDVGTQDNPNAELPGMNHLRTTDGRAVNKTGDRTYEIVGHPNIPVTSNDPNAP